jgi:hypothetical protein
MGFTAALYEGDSVIHTMPVIASIQARLSKNAGVARPIREVSALESADLGRAELKGWISLIGAISAAVRSVGNWIDRQSRDAHYRQIEGYLAQSTDHADLERRLRDLERGNKFIYG